MLFIIHHRSWGKENLLPASLYCPYCFAENKSPRIHRHPVSRQSLKNSKSQRRVYSTDHTGNRMLTAYEPLPRQHTYICPMSVSDQHGILPYNNVAGVSG
ncbi:hypothetical protein AALO_G00281110 [Alosa alosa]|uniref:Uncharacterized protein n=1 Tax=Alosa alosa TaxID=278164 RepID=A0AAV6FJL4_9TELE|nr:hypothetical protein AALO_G00281110 [Alosa alosa]